MDENLTSDYEEALRLVRLEKPDIKKVLALLNQAISEGDARASYALGTWYLHGEYIEKDVDQALSLLMFAAASNVPDAIFDLAVCYEEGTGVEKSELSAFTNYMKGALLGDAQSYFEVGRCFYYGIGTNKNIEVANAWLDKAAELGVQDEKPR
ncbi:MAG: sel1 repeat family protein [Candidatus Thiodiazotropha taylori]|nr:sel1 repeat family protein [Candidatus Thiodiazotropha taylori]